MSTNRIVVVSQIQQADGSFDAPTELYDFGIEDAHLAKARAHTEARKRLEELLLKAKLHDRSELPWLERITVCPRLSGIGRGGGDYIELGDRTLAITIGLE